MASFETFKARAVADSATPGIVAFALVLALTSRASAIDVVCPIKGADSNGWSIAAGGDFDGDGVDDVATGGPCAFANGLRRAGRVLVFSGADRSRLLALKGTKADQRLGAALAFIKDLDGDGADDLVVGSFAWDSNLNDAGKIEVRTFDGRVLLSVEGQFAAANFGEAVAAVGDVNGDGVADLLVGAGDDRRTGGDKVGRAYLLSGADGAVLDTSTGEAKTDSWGSTVAAAPDVNGDHVPDVIVASNLADDTLAAGENHGLIKVLSGADFTSVLLRLAGNAEDGLGRAVAAAGARGLYAGAPGADPQGKSKAGTVRFYSYAGEASPIITEPTPQIDAGFGNAVAVVGDLDGDGVVDVVASAPGAKVGALGDAGRVHAYSGKTQLRLWTVNGTRANEKLGQWLAGGGDLNGDSVPDVLIGAPGDAPNGRRGAGSVRVVSGVDGAEIMRLRGRRGLETRLFVAGRRLGGQPHLRSFDRRGRRREVGQDIFRGLEDGVLSLAVIENTGDPVPGDIKIVTGTGAGADRDTVEVFRGDRRNVRLSSFRGIGGTYAGGVNVGAGDVAEDVQFEIVAVQADSADGNVALKIWKRFSVDPLGRIAWIQQNAFNAFVSADVVDGEAVHAAGGTVVVGDVIKEMPPALPIDEILVGTTGGTSAVRIFDGAGNLLDEWLAFIPGGENVGTVIALGDLDGDGVNEIVTSPASGQSWIRAFSAAGTPKIVGSGEVNFFAFVAGAPAGIRLAVADVDLDGKGEIIVASGEGINGVVRAFEPDGSVVTGAWKNFLPYGPNGSLGLVIASTDRFLRN